MAAKAHAILSASSSDRWLHCPPSARLCETYEDKGSDYAAEGTDAHALGEHKLKTALGLPSDDPTDSLKWYSEEMEDCTSGYAEYVLEQIEAAKETCADPVVLIEQRVDFSRWVEQGFGTADCVIIADGTLRVIDYKHGLGVLVSAEENPQMQCYALGALELFDDIYDIDQVSMTIYQPRRQNVSIYEISKDDLYRWADEVLKPTADLAFAGDGNFLCGEWCGFCKAKNECRARAEANLKLAQHDFKLPPLLTDTEIEVILGKVDELVSWASDIKEYALQQALSGKEWTGFKIVEGRSNRRYSNEAAVIDAVEKAGFDPYEKKLLGVTAMQKLLGKSRFDELLTAYIEKPQGKPTLVPDSDKRLLLTGTLYSKKPVAVGKANGCLGMFGIRILWQGFQRLIEFSSGMGHAAYRNHLRACVRYLMVSCIAVCLQIAMESRKKCFRDFSASGGLIFIKDNGLLRVTASAAV